MIGERIVAHFITETLTPLVNSLDEVLGKCKNMDINKIDLEIFITKFFLFAIIKSLMAGIFYIIISVLLLHTVQCILQH